MNDERYEELKARVLARYEYWVPVMHLSNWNRRIVFHRHSPAGAQDDSVTTAMICVYWQYLEFTLEIYLGTIDNLDLSDDDLDRVLVHELYHPVDAELRRFVHSDHMSDHLDSEERAVSWQTNILCGYAESLAKWNQEQQERIDRLQARVNELEAAA